MKCKSSIHDRTFIFVYRFCCLTIFFVENFLRVDPATHCNFGNFENLLNYILSALGSYEYILSLKYLDININDRTI